LFLNKVFWFRKLSDNVLASGQQSFSDLRNFVAKPTNFFVHVFILFYHSRRELSRFYK